MSALRVARSVLFEVVSLLMTLITIGLLGTAFALLAGCTNKAPAGSVMLTDKEQRFSVQRVEVFKDDLAYENKRAVYIITDKKTKRQYFGVSGIGITELGAHTVNKITTQDER